jgi:hypothetical protein
MPPEYCSPVHNRINKMLLVRMNKRELDGRGI